MLDLREWLEKLEGEGALKVLKGFHQDLEIAATSVVMREGNQRADGEGSALLFDDIVGYPRGYRVLNNTIPRTRLAALCMGVTETDSRLELDQALRQKLPVWESEATQSKFNPKVVPTGPLMENIDSGKDVDLFKFPIVKWHELDAGRYIGPGDAVITRDPDTGEINIGMYRIQVHDSKTLGNWISPGHHGRLHREKYHAQGKPCPIAVSIGHHPLVSTIACHSVPFGREYNLIGAIRGEPMSVIKEEITGLPIPAASEIVIIGWVPPGKTRMEGPFGENTGYYSQFGETPVIEVERIYYRNNPIIGGLGSPSLLSHAMLLNHLERCEVPDVRGVAIGVPGTDCHGRWAVVSIKQRYSGHARQAALVASQAPIGGTGPAYHGRYVVVVDDDIDPSNIKEVLWAICTRSNPEIDIEILRRMWSTPLDPIIHRPGTKDWSNSRAIIDACRPFEWIDEFPPLITWSLELLGRVRQKIQE